MKIIDPQNLAKDIGIFIPSERIYKDEFRRRAFSVDASIFFRQASLVVDVADEKEVAALLSYSRTSGVGITFRGSGTSLNGQCSGSGILARLRGPFWEQTKISEQGRLIKAWCGVPGIKLNEILSSYHKAIGPDPASLASASFGGIVVNNAAGMCCTVEQNSYATMREMRLILFDGTILDTSDAQSVSNFRSSHKKLLDELLQIRSQILKDSELTERIRRKYRIKNTCGYSVNSFVDFADPIDILTHIIIGSEGTLGFLVNASLETIDTFSHRAAALIFFPNLNSAIKAVTRWQKSNTAQAAELFDGPTLRAFANLSSAPGIIKQLDIHACAILIEAKSNDKESLFEKISILEGAIENIDILSPFEFFTDEESCESLWAFRRAMFPAVAGAREPSEIVLIEDVCFPLDKLEEGCTGFARLFERYGYNGGLNGHVFHGNFHFALPVDMSSQKESSKAHAFIEDLMQAVAGLDGSLKAEHGTGFTVAPFVELEWGQKIYNIMQRTKRLFDPENIFNPGVLLNSDPKCHKKNLKAAIACHPILDSCVECGFCESVCPSKKIALTPRQRVSLWRHITHLKRQDPDKASKWEQEYDALGTTLCATDGICTTKCPLQVDVAQFVKDRRGQTATNFNRFTARKIGNHFSGFVNGTSKLLNGLALFQKLLGDAFMYKGAAAVKKMVGQGLPTWNEHMPRGAGKLIKISKAGPDTIVYMPSCAIRTMGDSVHDPAESLSRVTIRVLQRAAYCVVYPEKVSNLCCGKAFETKGLFEEATDKSVEMESALLKASHNGKYPIFCETSPCLARMRKVMDNRLTLYEPVEFATHYLADRLTLKKCQKRIAIHPTCSTRLLGLEESFFRLAEQCADEVIWPREIQCCGFSGDKGFSHPELNKSALEILSDRIQGCDMGYSTSRTCEIGLSLHGKIPYRSIMYLLDECSS